MEYIKVPKDRIKEMKTAEIINTVCSELGITKAELAKRMGMIPSSLYRKLARESMTFEELQKCLDVLGVTVEFQLKYPDGRTRSSQENHEMLLEKMDLLEKELEAARTAVHFQKKSLRDLRTDLNSAVGFVSLGGHHASDPRQYWEKIQLVLTNMESTISCALDEKSNEETPEEEPENMEMLKGKHVLLADDNELNREIMKEILTEHGLVVSEATDGRNALEAVKARDPGYFHFVLMDIEMPVMDGYESTMNIRRLPNRIRANIPIIALTANASPADREKAAAAGMDDFLAKPVNPALLLGRLIRFL